MKNRLIFSPPGLVLGLVILLPEPSTCSNELGKDWTKVNRGTSISPVEFRKDGLILFHESECRIEIANEDDTTTDISFSPLSPDKEFRIVIADVYDFEPAYLVDVRRCSVMHLPLPRYVQPWISWSPDVKHALFFTNYEASPQLWIVDLETHKILEVHRRGLAVKADSCCGLNEWAPKSGVAYVVPDTVAWTDIEDFRFRLEIFCNPYSDEPGWPCESGDSDHPRARYEVSVSVGQSKVSSGPRISIPSQHVPEKK